MVLQCCVWINSRIRVSKQGVTNNILFFSLRWKWQTRMLYSERQYTCAYQYTFRHKMNQQAVDDGTAMHETIISVHSIAIWLFGCQSDCRIWIDYNNWNGQMKRIVFLPNNLQSIQSPVNSPHKGQWRGALMFYLICAWINGWVNSLEAGDLRHHRAHYDVIVMSNKTSHVEQNIILSMMVGFDLDLRETLHRWFIIRARAYLDVFPDDQIHKHI